MRHGICQVGSLRRRHALQHDGHGHGPGLALGPAAVDQALHEGVDLWARQRQAVALGADDLGRRHQRARALRPARCAPCALRVPIVEAVQHVARECGESAARVALAWVIQRPGVSSTLMGVSKVEQVEDNIAALDIRLSEAHLAKLDKVSSTTPKMLYSLFTPSLRQHAVFGGSSVRSWAE
jgi:hypothetical protein